MNTTNITITSLEEIKKQYILKKYKYVESPILTAFDTKMINALYNVRNNYKEEFEKRKCIILLKELPKSTSIFEKNKIVTEKPNTDTNSKSDICTATLMNGKKCTAKSKPNCNFCGRHLKK